MLHAYPLLSVLAGDSRIRRLAPSLQCSNIGASTSPWAEADPGRAAGHHVGSRTGFPVYSTGQWTGSRGAQGARPCSTTLVGDHEPDEMSRSRVIKEESFDDRSY